MFLRLLALAALSIGLVAATPDTANASPSQIGGDKCQGYQRVVFTGPTCTDGFSTATFDVTFSGSIAFQDCLGCNSQLTFDVTVSNPLGSVTGSDSLSHIDECETRTIYTIDCPISDNGWVTVILGCYDCDQQP